MSREAGYPDIAVMRRRSSSFGPASIASVYRDAITRIYHDIIVFRYREKSGIHLNGHNAMKVALRILAQAPSVTLSTISARDDSSIDCVRL
jgi:hypothetical protein